MYSERFYGVMEIYNYTSVVLVSLDPAAEVF